MILPDLDLVKPFPEPGPLIRLAYRELRLAESGSPAQKELIGTLGDPSKPWEPSSCGGEDIRTELAIWLADVVTWLDENYGAPGEPVVADCWDRHPGIIRALALVADGRRQADSASNGVALVEWHRVHLPLLTDLSRELSRCCAAEHVDKVGWGESSARGL